MEIDRRSLMSGMLASGALFALGLPPCAFTESSVRKLGRCMLLLSGTESDGEFERGVRAAWTERAYHQGQITRLKAPFLTDYEVVSKLLVQSAGARWIVVMDDAGAIIFLELARTAGARLISMGSHARSMDGTCHFRHDFAATSFDHSAGGLLASDFIQQSDGFSITERFLKESPAEERGLTSWGAAGFSSYRIAGPGAIHVHCFGCSFPEGCRLIGLETTDDWRPIPPQVCTRESVTWRSRNWVESVGYAVGGSALGSTSVRESCMSRAFVHQSSDAKKAQPAKRFVSFVMDV